MKAIKAISGWQQEKTATGVDEIDQLPTRSEFSR
jgi:hypothetical protein